ncbi:MAG: DUF736 family protein [Sphingomonas sp.]|nr:MAG: DUF736 family protein [Sphingomonas sp.]
MNIGQFKNASGQLVGSIATATIDLPRLGLRPVESNNERAGALWQLTSNSTGEVFYQGKLDDPSLSEPLQITLFGNNEEGFRVVWNRAQPRRENMDGTRQSRRKAADDGFGNGNATDNGQLAEPQNDEIPAF